jgi:hypothetical protein
VVLYLSVSRKDAKLGCKGYMGTLGSEEQVFKLWDNWKCSADEMNNEAAAYSTLCSLWGKVIPRMIVYGQWGFCHTLVLEFIEVHNPCFLEVLGANIY